jgi:hypothetical protein
MTPIEIKDVEISGASSIPIDGGGGGLSLLPRKKNKFDEQIYGVGPFH